MLVKQTIELLQRYIDSLGYKPVIHFELEGCYSFSLQNKDKKLDFSAVNSILSSLNIEGELVPEYWANQWEYVSKFNGQSPLEEANNLDVVIKRLPAILALQGVEQTLIKPVVWSGDRGKLAVNCENVFSAEHRAVHIPNAVQINVSVVNENNENIVANTLFGDHLQYAFMQSSLGCCLLYLPEEEAFERLALKTRYGLAQELCSPVNISGGHQGSIALYKKIGKHNQPMGIKTLLVDQYNNALVSEYNWQETARIEHRLGASSLRYCAYSNVVFALLNVIEALHCYKNQTKIPIAPNEVNLPSSLNDTKLGHGAITLFRENQWFSHSINTVQNNFTDKISAQLPKNIGDKLKKSILESYQFTGEIYLEQ
ncbi:MAG: hypothetical protein MJK12_05710 [Colwellia sp.]|nr:hypothetical protein [Colwellia sp.]